MIERSCRQPCLAAAILFLLVSFPAASGAAERRSWTTLTDCEYMSSKDNDGDSFRVRCNTNEFVLRLYFVDAPETTLTYPERVRQQSEHFGITLDATLKAGIKARERAKRLLQEHFVVITRWAIAAGRGREPRYYGIVEVDGKSLAEVLIKEGLAQAKGIAPSPPTGEKSGAYRERLQALEREAHRQRTGAWAGAAESKDENRN